MSEDQCTKLFKYMQQRFDEIDARFETMATKQQFNTLMNILDGVISRQDTQELETMAVVSQLSRHESRFDRVVGRVDETDVKIESGLASMRARLAKRDSSRLLWPSPLESAKIQGYFAGVV